MRKKCRKMVKYGLLLGVVLGTNVNTSYGAYTSFVGNGQTVYDEEVILLNNGLPVVEKRLVLL